LILSRDFAISVVQNGDGISPSSFIRQAAREGYCNIPSDYPDKALLHWISKQQGEIYDHCISKPAGQLPLHLRTLVTIGLHGKGRDSLPTLSTRIGKAKPTTKSKGIKSKRHVD
jgi:hypothetical protein